MAKGRYVHSAPSSHKKGVSRFKVASASKSRDVNFRHRTFKVEEARRKPHLRSRVLGGFAFDIGNKSAGFDFEAAGDVIQTGVEHFYSPLFPTDLLEKPVDAAQAREYYRHFYRRDPYVGRAIDLHCDLPVSKIRLKLPDCKDKELARKILKFYEEMCRRLRLAKRLREVALEYWLFGASWPFHEWDDEKKVWRSLTCMNPDSLEVESYPYTDYVRVSIKPSAEDQLLLQQAQANPDDENLQKAIEDIPADILERVEAGLNIPLDTDPYEGSFVHHFARRKLSSDVYGVSILERVLDTLIYRDKLRQAQSMIASRSMTPKNLVWADNLSDPDLEELREQVDLAIADPDFSIVSNYELHWTQIGAEGRLLDMATEYDYTETLLTVGLGVTRELLTGEGTFSGNRIGLEVMNTCYMTLRDDMAEYVEEYLFRPVAVANDFYELDEDGNKVYLYPRLTFTRLALRDNVDTFDMLFNLYQKGSIDISVILDLLNIDASDTKDKLERDIFTVNDATFNQLLQNLYTNAATAMVEKTDIVARLAKYLKLKMISIPGGEESEGGGGGGSGVPLPEGGGEEGAPPEGGGEEGAPPEGGGEEGAPPEGGGAPETPPAVVRQARNAPRVVGKVRKVSDNNGMFLSAQGVAKRGLGLVVNKRAWRL